MKGFTDIFVRRPVLAIVVNVLIIIAGLQAWKTLSVRQYPRSENASVTIATVYIGASAETVRGFKEGTLSGDRGAYTRQELHWTGIASGTGVVPYLFLDYGRVRLLVDPAYSHLASYGLGTRLAWHGFTAEAAWARPFSAPAWVATHGRLHITLDFQF